MAILSNIAILIAVGLVVFVLLAGPTHFFMRIIVESFGDYLTNVLSHGFRTYTFYEEAVDQWFNDWTLTYRVYRRVLVPMLTRPVLGAVFLAIMAMFLMVRAHDCMSESPAG